MEFPRVSSRPFLTAGGGVCLAMVVVSPVSWRVRVAPARLARDAQHWSEQHRWVSEFSGNTWEQWDEVSPRSSKYLPVLLVRLSLAHKQCLRNEFA